MEEKPNENQLKNVILNHVTKKLGNSEMMYKSHLYGEKIVAQSTRINSEVVNIK